MKRFLLAPACLLSLLAGCAATGGDDAALHATDDKAVAAPAQQGEMQLPPGYTEADMQACMLAGIPGEMQAHLVEGAGVWQGKSKMWMAPGMEPIESTCTSTVTSMMDGRYVRNEIAGEVPGMGPFSGFALYGFDNVSKKFQSTWIDSMSTGFMNGVGELSADGKVMTWTYSYTCPIAKKTATMREIETIKGKDKRTLDMFMTNPKTGEEYHAMQIEFTRSGS